MIHQHVPVTNVCMNFKKGFCMPESEVIKYCPIHITFHSEIVLYKSTYMYILSVPNNEVNFYYLKTSF